MADSSLEIKWLRYATGLFIVYYVVATFSLSFDPGYVLEGLIVDELYNGDFMPFDAILIYDLLFLLFSWTSVILFVLLYGLNHFGIAKKQKWAYDFFVIGLVLWLGGGLAISLMQQVYSYLFSLLGILLFVPPLLTLRKQFYGVKKK